ncbi:MAG: RagB/SusD family nutrient uptake outer membrane protein [Rhizobacter sp.]|nr:RagB/SusD family nutrient uptake outer membrane protein [Ferruginibacter sp.]
MKQIFLYASCCLLITAGVGCNKYLDKEPDNRAKVNTPEKVSQLLGTAYPQSNYQAFAETMSDNVADLGSGGSDNVIHDPFYFIDTKENQQDSPESYWYGCYTAIAAANQALQTIGKADNPNDYIAQKGEALVARAYAHFMLVNFFSKFYDVATAATDAGIPYVTQPENVFIRQYERKTVQYVYDMIEKDLLEGIPLIKDNVYDVPKYHFNKAAAYAFACRYYLFKKDYAKVVQYADLAVPGNNFVTNLRGWNTTYKNITDVTELFKIYAKASENANLLIVETQSLWARYYYSSRYGVDANKQNLIFPRPDRLTGGNFAFSQYSLGDNKLIPKIDEYFVKVSVNAEIGYPYVMVPLFSVEEVLFNRAEAYTYLNNTAGAVADLNTYASARITNYSATTHSITEAKINTTFGTTAIKDGLIQAILYYKRAEFIHEGLRWFDILRYKLPVVHTASPTVPGGTGTVIATLAADDLRKVIQIPPSTSLAGLAPNPR